MHFIAANWYTISDYFSDFNSSITADTNDSGDLSATWENNYNTNNTQENKPEKGPGIDFVRLVTNRSNEGIALYNTLVKANRNGLIDLLISKDITDNVSIEDLQLILKLFGYYNGRIDGLYGKNTQVAVKNYKKLLNFPDNNSELDENFISYVSELKQFAHTVFSNLDLNNVTVIENYTRIQVFEMQGFLYTLDLYDQRVNGYYDEKTIESIKKFQAQIGMRVDGLISRELLVNLHVVYCFCYANFLTNAELNFLLKFRYVNEDDSIIQY
jgi:peptidoglycan hydrolase-like protein with peptidoglycan-binding domain